MTPKPLTVQQLCSAAVELLIFRNYMLVDRHNDGTRYTRTYRRKLVGRFYRTSQKKTTLWNIRGAFKFS